MKSFSFEVKEEILNIPMRFRREKMAFLAALVHSAGSIFLSSDGMRLVIVSQTARIKIFVDEVLFNVYKAKSQLDESGNLVISGVYLKKLLEDCCILKTDENNLVTIQAGIDKTVVTDDISKIAYIRGAFLGSGSVSLKSGYHLEFALSNREFANDLKALLDSFSLTGMIVKRKEKAVLYIKNSDTISDLLALIGAHKSVLKLNNKMADRFSKKSANRKFNCDLANIDKTLNSALLELEAIKVLKKNGLYDKLNTGLQEAAKIREENPSSSLNDLAVLLGISKSGMRHRLKKIIELSFES